MTRRDGSPVAIVTGAAGGIGSACARSLQQDGFSLVLIDTDPQVEAMGRDMAAGAQDAMAIVADVANDSQIAAAVGAVLERFARIDALVNVAGIHLGTADGSGHDATEITLEQWSRVVAVNLTAPFLLCRSVLPIMRSKNGGRIVNLISRAGRMYVPGVSADYAATKAGLQGLTRVLAGENARYGITANCVAPGRIDTTLTSNQHQDMGTRIVAGVPAGRVGTPAEVAGVVSYLCSPAAAYVTGAVIDINGGGFMP